MLSSTKIFRVLSFLLLLILANQIIHAQNGRLIGWVDNDLVEINPQTGTLTPITSIVPPVFDNKYNLAYSSVDCLFYGIKSNNNHSDPTLVSIDMDGNYSEIGIVTLPGETVYFCEALAFNYTDNKLYAAASLNGGTGSSDYFSESIIEINPSTATATFKASLAVNSTLETDIDDMVFIGNTLYIHDGDSGPNQSEFYEIDFQGLGVVANPNVILSTSYQSNQDMGAIDNQLFMTLGGFEFYRLDIPSSTITYVGQTHTAADYNGKPIHGLDFVVEQALELLDTDTMLCQGEELILNIDLNGAIVTWNTGQTSETITIDNSGSYWADIQIGNCFYLSDTAYVAYEDCDTCLIVFNQISNDLLLGNDTILCDFQELELSLFPEIDASIIWSTNETGNSIVVNQTGEYWANILYGDCTWTSESIFLQIEACDTCEFVQEQIQELLFIGNDTSICLEGSLQLSLDLEPPFQIQWNNGDSGSNTTIDQAGTYWATIFLESCNFQSDFLALNMINCAPCQYYIPNIFSPNGDGLNDDFQVYFDSETCNVESFEISIFDRWGNLVAQNSENKWNGKYGSEPSISGVYVYQINMVVNHLEELIIISETGDVTLIR